MADQETFEQHLDIPLDDEVPTSREPVYVDAVVKTHDRQPIVPAGWRGWTNIRSSLRFHRDLFAYRAGYHGSRLVTRYLWLGLFWAVVGVFRLAGRQIRWWWVIETVALAQEAATKNDWFTYKAALDKGRKVRLFRGIVLLGEAVLLVAAGVVLAFQSPWLQLLVAVLAVPPLAHIGRPIDRRIVTPAVVTPRLRRINPDIVLRAYYAAGLGSPDKPDQQITFGSQMSREGEGSGVLVDLPYGKGFKQVIEAKGGLASGLDVALSQVFLTVDPSSNRRHKLWVADRDPLAIGAGRTPLLNGKATDIWKPAPFGLDERGQRVTVPLMWNSMLIGAQPRQGKTFSARALGLYAAMDPYVRLTVFDGKGSPDWRGFDQVADRYGFGLALNRDGDPVELFIDTLERIKADVQDRYERLSELARKSPALVPEGKLTREIARDPSFGMPVHIVILDEFQEYFDLGDDSKRIASLLVYLVKVAPAAGYILLDATQRPSGVAPGQVGQQFISFRDNHQVRFALRTGSWQMSDLVMGAGAYSEGYDSSTLLPTYKGVGILRGATDETPTVRTYLADGQDAEKILARARQLRIAAGTLTGMAAGDAAERDSRDVLSDVIRVFAHAGRAGLQWAELAELLAAEQPEAYAGTTGDSISALVRAAGVPSVDVKREGVALKGCRREAVETALEAREIGS